MNTTNVEKVFDLYVKKSYSSEIEKYLSSLDVSDEEKQEIKQSAYEKYTDYSVKRLVNKNKFYLILSLSSAIILLFVFFYIIPKQNINNDFFYCIGGSVLISFSLYCSFVFLTSIDKEKMRSVAHSQGFDYSAFFTLFFAMGIIPGVMLYFLISWTIESGQGKILEETKIFTTATVIDGRSVERTSLRGRKSDTTYIIVEFENKKGEKVKRKIDISKYEFGDFGKDQHVNLIYSSVNDYNIKVLNKDADLAKYTHSQQRDFTINDLVALFDEDDVVKFLNNIRYGWENRGPEEWINENDQSIIKKEKDVLIYFGSNKDYLKFTRNMSNDYREIVDENSKNYMIPFGSKTYENDKYNIVIEPLTENGQPVNTVVNISLKKTNVSNK
ncbi:hypothetical protein [Epilithonimonas mollis]|uniref:Uncharacterized protein n=1 Tax=Epilithonimonas mollis TaxID=216903 RepID=A0A1M6PZY6_9FLAO|nr:hypothetical protein [Epilithonimonas mollis]SHK13503.1 hypothetical protein SAMN05444371_1432 [Epilithonimonas mollis]